MKIIALAFSVIVIAAIAAAFYVSVADVAFEQQEIVKEIPADVLLKN